MLTIEEVNLRYLRHKAIGVDKTITELYHQLLGTMQDNIRLRELLDEALLLSETRS